MFAKKVQVILSAIVIFFSMWVITDVSHTLILSTKPSSRSAVFVMPILEGSYNSRRMCETCLLSNVFFQNTCFCILSFECISVPYNATTLRRCSFESNFTLFGVVCITENLFFQQCWTFYWRMTHSSTVPDIWFKLEIDLSSNEATPHRVALGWCDFQYYCKCVHMKQLCMIWDCCSM